MGCTGISGDQYKVATLNFSGICLSPFEYHDCSVEKDVLSSKFDQILRFKWQLEKIDQKLQKQRYTPIYNQRIGIEKGKLLTQQQFKQYWNEHFSKLTLNIIKQYIQDKKSEGQTDQDKKPQGKEKKIKQQQEIWKLILQNPKINHCRQFDFLCYETFLCFVYNIKSQIIKDSEKLRKYSANKYQRFLQEWLTKPYLSNQLKFKKVMEIIKNKKLDVLFLQQADYVRQFKQKQKQNKTKYCYFQNQLKNYEIVTCKKDEGQSVIIYNSQRIKSIRSQLKQQQIKQIQKKYIQNKKLFWNRDSCYILINGILLISSHLKSNKQKNAQQGKQMCETLLQIKKDYKNIIIVIGIDANHFMGDYQIMNKDETKNKNKDNKNKNTDNKNNNNSTDNQKKYFYIYPEQKNVYTTIKKRTSIQPQTDKANQIVMQCKDHIISTQILIKTKILTIDGDQIQTNSKKIETGFVGNFIKKSQPYQFLPNNKHPFDHFLLRAKIQNPK